MKAVRHQENKAKQRKAAMAVKGKPMIETYNLVKKFDGIRALDDVSLQIEDKGVFGLIGTNGAGKSTLLRLISGVLKADEGSVCVDNMPVYDNAKIKEQIFFISDDPYYFSNSTPKEMAAYYRKVYPGFDKQKFADLMKALGLEEGRRISTFSKGMKKQLAIILGVSAGTRYLLCDETFDGLDPVMRQGVKTLFAREMEDRGLTPVIASHNLRELEDICDHVGLIHKGGVLLSREIGDMKLNLQKLQVVFTSEEEEKKALEELDVMIDEVRGRLHTWTVRGTREEVESVMRGVSTVFYEVLALSLEEIFISETEVVGYDLKKFILD